MTLSTSPLYHFGYNRTISLLYSIFKDQWKLSFPSIEYSYSLILVSSEGIEPYALIHLAFKREMVYSHSLGTPPIFLQTYINFFKFFSPFSNFFCFLVSHCHIKYVYVRSNQNFRLILFICPIFFCIFHFLSPFLLEQATGFEPVRDISHRDLQSRTFGLSVIPALFNQQKTLKFLLEGCFNWI